MAMKSMQLTAEEAKNEYACEPCPSEDKGPKYPYGLELRLGDEAMSKLGLDLLPVGTEVMVMAKAVVTGTSQRERAAGKLHVDMEVQITDLELMASTVDRQARAAGRLYPEGD